MTLNEGRRRETHTILGSKNVHFVKEDQDRKLFWRESISLKEGSLACLMQYAPQAFPDIYFVDSVLRNLNTLGGGYLASRDCVQDALAKLDDLGKWVFSCPPPAITPSEHQQKNDNSQPPNRLIINRFANLGLDVVPEKPNVQKNNHCCRAREAEIGGRIVYCEWHIRLEPNRNRIHIHRPVKESCEKVVVGVIAKHLPLP